MGWGGSLFCAMGGVSLKKGGPVHGLNASLL